MGLGPDRYRKSAIHENLRTEEIMTRRQNDGTRKRYRNLDLLTGYRPFTTGFHGDAVYHSIGRR